MARKEARHYRLDSDIIAWLKADGCGYQTKANWPLGRNASLHQKRSNIIQRPGKASQQKIRT
jgi:hypothetical protein